MAVVTKKWFIFIDEEEIPTFLDKYVFFFFFSCHSFGLELTIDVLKINVEHKQMGWYKTKLIQ